MAAAPKRAELARYFELEAERKSLQRQAKDLEKLQAELEEKFTAYVLAEGGPERALMRCGYRLAIDSKPGSVSWKGEFLKLAGPERAEELVQAAPSKDVLVIEPPG